MTDYTQHGTENATIASTGLKTTDGIEVVHGLAVWTNEMKVGLIDLSRFRAAVHDGWFDVRYATGGTVMQNGDRVATRFEGRSAEEAWNAVTGGASIDDLT